MLQISHQAPGRFVSVLCFCCVTALQRDHDSPGRCPCSQPAGSSPPPSFLKLRGDRPLASDGWSHLFHLSTALLPLYFPSLGHCLTLCTQILVHFCPPPCRHTEYPTHSAAFASEFSGPVRCLSVSPPPAPEISECPPRLCSLLTPGSGERPLP